MSGTETNTRQIARNSAMLYLRMLVNLAVGLLTTRVVLQTLGFVDFGIYGVVGGVVSMLVFINTSMSGATTRFLSFELGRCDEGRLQLTFSNAIIAHVIIAAVVFVIAETVGLWFVAYKLVIPPERMLAAHVVYQLSILMAVVTIVQSPFTAAIFAHEQMDVFARVEILKSLLLLVIVYLLTICDFDKLILYASLQFVIFALIMLLYRFYCRRHYEETHASWRVNRTVIGPLLSFSGWDLYGNASFAARQHGTNFLINMFFGLIYNATSSITTTVNAALSGLTMAMVQAFRPAIIKQYAVGQYADMTSLMCQAAKLAVMLLGCMIVPCMLETPYILHLWLADVPPLTVVFCRLLMVATTFGIINSVVVIGIHATGRIKMLSFLSGSLYLLSLPVIYLLYKLKCNVEVAYIVHAVVMAIMLLTNVLIMRRLMSRFEAGRFLFQVALALVCVAMCGMLMMWLRSCMPESWIRLLLIVVANGILIAACTFFMLGAATRQQICSQMMKCIS